MFPRVQPSRHSEASETMIQGAFITAQVGSRPWHHPYGADFLDMQDARVLESGKNTLKFQRMT